MISRLPQPLANPKSPSRTLNPIHGRDHESADRRVAALARVAQELSPKQITSIITKAVAGDPETTSALAWDGVSVDDLRQLLRGQASSQMLDQFSWRGRWKGTEPKLFIVAPDEETGLEFMSRQRLDPFRSFVYADAAECRRDVSINERAGVSVEVVIIGQAVRS